MKKILFPTDFSQTAHNAFVFAVEIAKAQHARITLMHTYRLPLDYHIPPDVLEQLEENEHERLSKSLDKFLQTFIAHYDCGEVIFKTMAVEGFTSEAIAQTAADEHVDLIVMGTKGASGLEAALLGSMTASVIEKAACPVLAIPEHAKFNGFANIIYASDFSPQDYNSIHTLATFGKKFGAHTHCLHISEDEDYFIDDVAFDLMKEQYGDLFPKDKIDFKVMLANSLGQGMEEAITQYEAQLIAMTTHKRNFLQRLFSPSQTKKMAFHSKVPLLVFKA